jgi:hypothetical protein
MHFKTHLPNTHIQKKIFACSPTPLTGLVQLQDKIVVRFALTIYPYSLGGRRNCGILSNVSQVYQVAVGMPIARHPPHRSVHEELPHTAPASGNNAKAH